MCPTRVAKAVHRLSVISGNHLGEYLLYADVKSVILCQYERGQKKNLQNTSVDQAHIAHNANRRLCELIMSSQNFPYRLRVGTCEWLAITQSQTLRLALVRHGVESYPKRDDELDELLWVGCHRQESRVGRGQAQRWLNLHIWAWQ
jgi:hypothetical protein